jgi:prephenate dehydrogenase
MKFAIIGGSGKMGQWFARLLVQEGQQVLLIGRSEPKLLAVKEQLDVDVANVDVATDIARVAEADVVMVSVPLDAFEAVVAELAPHTRAEQMVLDVTSLKTKPVDVMHRHVGSAAVLGMHPVFGPGARSLAGLNFVLTPTNERETSLAYQVRGLLEERGARVSLMTPQEHDDMMTVVLGLAHFIAIVSADVLLGQSSFQQLKQVGGTTYKLLYTLVESVISEDPELYASLQMSFPDIARVEGSFLQAASEWAEIVKNGDRQAFAGRMTALRDKLEETDPEFRKAYEDMYRVTEGL